MAKAARSLRAEHPWRLEAPIGVVASLALIIVGLSLPVMSIQKLVFWKDDYSILEGVQGLWGNGDYTLAIIIFTFSVVFPNGKLLALLGVWFAPMTDAGRERALWWLAALGRWSMLDVFIVAMTVFLSQSKGALDASPKIGLYVFTAGVLGSLVMTLWIDRLARRARNDGG